MTDNELDQLIRQAQPTPEIPASFQREVWERITMAQEASWSERWRRVGESILNVVIQPAPAVAVVMTMLLLGTGLGRLTTGDYSPADARIAYISSINPLAAVHPASRR